MTAAVTMACSGLSFSRMSLISSVLFSVIILNSPFVYANVCSDFSLYDYIRKVKQILSNCGTVL